MTSGTPAPGATQPGGCPDPQRLEELLRADARPDAGAGTGTGAGADLARHLEACAACRRRLDDLAGGSDWLARLSAGGVTSDTVDANAMPPLLQAVMDELRHFPRPSPDAAGSPDSEAGAKVPEIDFLEPCTLPGYRGRFGPYLVIDVVGRGGMGVVLKAHDPALDRIVAIKVLSPELAANPSARRRFVREARAAAAVSHEHVVTIHAVDEAGGAGRSGLPYLVMQFVSGRSLEARLREAGPLKLEEILRIGMQAAAGLAAAHAQGLVHRDVKPANIMLENGVERVKLTDFGLARAADDAAITLTGQVTGTPHYMAPEQARGERVDHRADLFGLGGVLYALCTGRPPFRGSGALAVLRKVCEEEPVPIAQINEDIPPWLVDIVAGLMRKDPAARPQSAEAVAAQLGKHLAGLQLPGAKAWEVPTSVGAAEAGAFPSAPSRRRRVGVTVTAAGMLLALVAATAFMAQSGITRRLGGGSDGGRDGGASAAMPGADAATRASSGFAAAAAPSAAAAPVAAPAPALAPSERPFAVVAASGGEPRLFARLIEAVQAAEPGATIEIRHDGPVDAPTIDLGRKPLRLRAGKGYMPVFEQPSRHEPILATQGALVLEGLTFQGRPPGQTRGRADAGAAAPCLLAATSGPLYISNCRFTVRGGPTARVGCVRVSQAVACVIRNSELHALRGDGVQWTPAASGATASAAAASAAAASAAAALRLDNVIASSRMVVVVRKEDDAPARLRVSRCTLVGAAMVAADVVIEPTGLVVDLADDVMSLRALLCDPQGGGAPGRLKGVPIQSAGTVLDYVTPDDPDTTGLPATTSLEAATGLADPTATSTRPAPTGRAGARSRSFIDGRVQFSRDIRARSAQGEFPAVTDFQVQWVKVSSRGVIAPRRLATLGARTDTVGPGGPYETFRRSPAYETWQHETDAALAGAVAEPGRGAPAVR